jgi:hypothetical protein
MSDQKSEQRAEIARQLERIAAEFEMAAKHAKVAARHIQGGEIPRFAAHVLAAQGHAFNAAQIVEDIAKLHAAKATVD